MYTEYIWHRKQASWDKTEKQKEKLFVITQYYTSISLMQASQFDRDDVDLKGFVDYFWKSASDKMDRASTLMTYQNLRGGRINLKDIKKPDRDEWGSAAEAMEAALDVEKTVNQGLLDLDRTAEEHLDPEVSCRHAFGIYMHECVSCVCACACVCVHACGCVLRVCVCVCVYVCMCERVCFACVVSHVCVVLSVPSSYATDLSTNVCRQPVQ